MNWRTFAVLLLLAAGAAADQPPAAAIRPLPLVPISGEAKALDFEDGQVPRASQAGYGLTFFVNVKANRGLYTWSLDPMMGANGSKKSLRLDVQSGNFYFYFASDDRKRFVDVARGANRMSFWLKLPVGWGSAARVNENLNVGTYLRDPRRFEGQVESKNNHHYFQLYLVPDGQWIRVVVGDAPHHQRSIRGLDPAKTSWRPEIASFYDALTRFYICGVPCEKLNFSPAPTPYRVWFDELTFFYEDERVEAHPEASVRRGRAGTSVAHPVRITNTHPSETRRFQYKVTGRADDDRMWEGATLVVDDNGNGRLDPGESTPALATPSLAPGESHRTLLVERVPQVMAASATFGFAGEGVVGSRRTSVLAYQVEPAVQPYDRRVQNRSIFRDRGDQRAPTAGTLCVTQIVVGDLSAEPDAAPPAPADLAAKPFSASASELTWTAPGAGAAAYDVRVSLEPIETDEDFARAMPIPGEPTPAHEPGARESVLVRGLDPKRTYHAALRVEGRTGQRAPAKSVKLEQAQAPAQR